MSAPFPEGCATALKDKLGVGRCTRDLLANSGQTRADSVMVISESLLKFDDDTAYVEIETGEQQFKKRIIETGLSDGINIQVLSGLNEEDKIKKAS